MKLSQNQSGRSMVEILGVLVIIGVLSIGGIMGYNYAIAKNKANEITSELNLRAIVLSQQQTQSPKPAETTLTMEMGNTMKFGNEVSAEVSVNPEYFEITVADVEKQACKLILQDYTTSAWMIINGTLYENTPTVCDADKNTMTFVYKNDLGEKRNCATKGFFNITSYKCECAGGTYFDNTTKDCVCPAGHIWSETERKCIESRCQEGEFETKDGCIRCDDSNTYLMTQSNAKSLCESCGNRTWLKLYSLCIPSCVKGESVPNAGDGVCISCDTNSDNISVDPNVHDYCNACPNRYASAQSCYRNDFCDEVGKIWGSTRGDSTRTCVSCDDPREISLGYEYMGIAQKQKDACTACKNDAGQANRSLVKVGSILYCVKTVCDADEFMGADGSCRSCNDIIAYPVNENSGCTNTACGRTETTVTNANETITYCSLATCDTTDDKNVLLANGTCQSCTNPSSFASSEEECSRCAGRGWTSGENQTGVCTELCSYGTHVPHIGVDRGQKLCYSCKGMSDGSVRTGISNYAKTYCEACGNYLGEDGYCYYYNSCKRGTEFRSQSTNNYMFCTTCDYIDKVKMINHEEHRKMCTDCVSTPRFFAEDYCYRCDSSESPVVTTAEERASCTKCPNRQINADNQCVLVITEE